MNTRNIMMRAIFAVALIFANTAKAQDNTIHDGGEYYLYNIYYDRCLGGNAENNGPALSKTGNDMSNYVWVAEASSLHSGWYWLRHKATGKYLQASNKEGDTWSCWFAGSLNKAYNSYEWLLQEGEDGYIKSNRGEAINGANKCYLGIDKGAESKDYISIYYDKALGEISAWQIVDAHSPLADSRLKLYTGKLDETIARGEAIYDNPYYNKPDELAVALYNARSARETASLDNVNMMVTATKALVAAITNAQEGKYKIIISGSSMGNYDKFIVDINALKVSNEEVEFVIRSANKSGAIVYISSKSIRIGETTINTDGNYEKLSLRFNGKNVEVSQNGKVVGNIPQSIVPVVTSVGQSAEISIIGEELISDCQMTYTPITEGDKLTPNEYGKYTSYCIYMKGGSLDTPLLVNEKTNMHVLATENPLGSSIVSLHGDGAYLIFDNIRPSIVKKKYLKQIRIDGKTAIDGTNCRVAIYLHGAVVYPFTKNDIAMYAYSGELYSGTEYQLKLGKNDNLGTADNEISSFILKQGYMVCLSTVKDGSGYSRIYVADHGDKRNDVVPDLLRGRISRAYIRKWNWVSKKGWCSTESSSAIEAEGKELGCTWFYTWSADRSSTTDMEYVPHKNHIYWPSWSNIDRDDATAVLGYNEPDHSEQHSDDCGTTIDPWKACTHQPEFMACGLRIGSPCPTDASWVKQFIKHCDDMAYRCDFVTFHAYWGTNEAANSDSWWWQLEQIYKDTGRPIWLTEWNNGASWTTEGWPSSYSDKLAKQKNAIKYILSVLDNASFIERYSLYNWDSYYRAAISWDSDKNSWWVTPCGEVYRDTHPTHAYNEKMQKVPIGWFPGINKENKFSFTFVESTQNILMSITNKNGDFTGQEIIEYKDADGKWKTFYDNSSKRSKFESSKLRMENVSLDNCNTQLFTNEKLTLRLRIITLKGDATTTEAVTKDIPESIRNRYNEAVGINKVTHDDSQAEYYTLDGKKTNYPTSQKVYIYKNKKGETKKVTK
ncbi:MAG: hypothetical protein IKQ72_09545 [Bacteroidaceae bacterium]|nr:hypothetical protein [Bacteroidaceae bacterium]